MENKNVALIFLLFIVVGCSQKMTLAKINYPSEKYFEIEQTAINERYPELNKQSTEYESSSFDRRIKMRSKVLDSLNLINHERIIIIDTEKDFNGKTKDGSYIFFDDKILKIGYERKEEKRNEKNVVEENPYVESVTEKSLKNSNDEDVLMVYNYFDKDNIQKIRGDITFNSFVYFNITLILENKVSYYEIRSSAQGYSVKKRE